MCALSSSHDVFASAGIFGGSLSWLIFCYFRSSGDWFGVAIAHAAKARLHMATRRFGEAVSGFQLALKVGQVYLKIGSGRAGCAHLCQLTTPVCSAR